MSNQFDELTKSLAQSVTRRQAFKKFGVGLAGMALAAFGLANKAEASRRGPRSCQVDTDCPWNQVCDWRVCATPCNTNADCLAAQHSTGGCCWQSYGHTGYVGVCRSCRITDL